MGAAYQYKYVARETTILDDSQRATRVLHTESGLPTAITNALGSATEVRYDGDNRVAALIERGAIRATLHYGKHGSLEKLVRADAEGAVEITYEYTDGRLDRAVASDGTVEQFSYNQSGDLIEKRDSDELVRYEYSATGDLRYAETSSEKLSFTHNVNGQVESIQSSEGTTRLAYNALGRVESVHFADGSQSSYLYNALGFRQAAKHGDENEVTYLYDVAGNLTFSDGRASPGDHSGDDHNHAIEINQYNQATRIRYPGKEAVRVSYDPNGNPEVLTTSEDPEVPPVRYLYDAGNRVVAVEKAGKVIGSYAYADGEADLRIQLDARTMRVPSIAVRQSASVGNIDAILYARPYGSHLGTVRYEEATQAFALSGELGMAEPDAVASNSLQRRRFLGVNKSEPEVQEKFHLPSNVIFLPPEYATINCAPGCQFNGYTARVNTASTNAVAIQNSAAALAVSANQPNSCDLLLCTWYLNDVIPIAFGKNTTYTFLDTGLYSVTASCECSPCDYLDSDDVLVSVVCSTTVTIGSPANNASPSDAAWQTNYSFLSTSTISGTASAVPTTYNGAIAWTITPTIGSVQSVTPANALGPNISFQPNVTHTSGGSFSASPALSYALRATRCGSQPTHTITQDTRDRIRQEYTNHTVTVPARADVVTSSATTHFSSGINAGNYSLIVGGPGGLAEQVWTAYNAGLRTALANPAFPDQNLTLTSGYRNPERNEAVGGGMTSKHQYGDAVDLVWLAGTQTASQLTPAQLWAILEAAGDTAGTAICEHSNGSQVTCNDPGVDHVHVQR